MLSTPELRQRAAVTAPCLPLAGSLALTQTHQQRHQPDASLPVNARRDAQQTLPAVVLITVEGGCYGSGFFVTNDLNTTNNHVLDCGGRGTVSIAGNRRTLPVTASLSDSQHFLALVCITGECPVAENRRR